MGQLPFWWQRGTLKFTEVKALAQPHTAKQQKEGSTPDCRALESMLIVLHHLSPVLMRWCLDEMKLRMVVIKRKVNTKHSVPPGPQIASCFGAGPISHAKLILLSYVWLAFTVFDLKLMSFLVVVLSTFHLRICLVFSCPTALHFRCTKWRHW